jgi:hypothetical protein
VADVTAPCLADSPVLMALVALRGAGGGSSSTGGDTPLALWRAARSTP